MPLEGKRCGESNQGGCLCPGSVSSMTADEQEAMVRAGIGPATVMGEGA